MALGDDLNNAKNNAKGVNEEIKSLYEQLRGVTSEIKGQATSISKSREAFRAFEKGAQNLKLQYEGINNLTDDQVKKLTQQLTKQKAIAEQEFKRLITENKIKSQLDEINNLIAQENLSLDEQNDLRLGLIQYTQHLSDEEKAILSSQLDEGKALEKIVEESQNELSLRNEINNKLGITGGLLTALKDLSPALAKGLKIDEVADGMRAFADESLRAGENVGRLRVAAKGAKIAFKNLGDTLTDPAVIGGALIKGFVDVQNAQKEFRSATGQNINQFDTLNTSILTSAEYIKSAANLSKELGINAAVVFSTETIAEVGELTELMGLGAKEASNLAAFAKLSGKELSSVTKNIEKSTINFIKTNKQSVSLRDVMSDVGGVSKAVSVSLGGNDEKLLAASLAARKLGISLEQVDKIAGSLLNFESSIEAELAAELITGKQINLEKARQLALDNDLEGVANELMKNQAVMNAFATGNRIEQEAVAKAMGMGREEMAQMIFNQQISKGLSTEQAAKAADINLEEAKRLTVQKQISNALDKITQAFGGILTLITPILDNSVMLSAVVGTIATVYAVKLAKSFGSMAKDSFSTLKNVKDMASAAISTEGGIGTKLKAGLGIGDAGKDMEKVPNKTAESGKGIKGFLKGLGDGLASIGRQFMDVVKGATALGITGLVLGGSFALAMMMVEDVDPAQMLAFSASLSALGLTVAFMGKIGGSIIKGALAMGILGVGLIPAAYAFSLLEGVDPKSMLAFAAALPILGLSVLGLGLIFSNPITAILFGLGVIGLVALGAALIPLASAFGKIGDAIKGNEIEQTFSSLFKLSSIAPGIEATAEALHSIADGLGAIADEGTAALPILKELNALGGAADGGGSENSEMAQVNANLERLISLVEQGGDVFIDGSKVGKSLQLASSKIG